MILILALFYLFATPAFGAVCPAPVNSMPAPPVISGAGQSESIRHLRPHFHNASE
jgi:hypothetical protein